MSVYVIRSGNSDLHKIGVSREPLKRLATLQTGNPEKLILMACYPCKNPYSAERKIHTRLRRENVNGEWFRLPSLRVLDTVADVVLEEEPIRDHNPNNSVTTSTCKKCHRQLTQVREGAYAPTNNEGYYHSGRYCPFEEKVANAPTKALPDDQFRKYRREKQAAYRKCGKNMRHPTLGFNATL
jgi:hypothetical protein